MKTLYNGLQCEILKVFRNQSNNYKTNERKEFADLLRVKLSDGKTVIICATELIN